MGKRRNRYGVPPIFEYLVTLYRIACSLMTMKEKVFAIILVALVAASILVFVFDAPFLFCLFTPIVTVVYFTEVYVRRKTRKIYGDANKNLGGGYQSGGRLPGWTPNGDGKGSGGVNASGVKVTGAGGGGWFGAGRG